MANDCERDQFYCLRASISTGLRSLEGSWFNDWGTRYLRDCVAVIAGNAAIDLAQWVTANLLVVTSQIPNTFPDADAEPFKYIDAAIKSWETFGLYQRR